jgi:lysophospholipase L1-like esterase
VVGGLSPGDDVTAEQIIQGHKQLIKRAHVRRLKIYGATMTPVEGFLVPGTLSLSSRPRTSLSARPSMRGSIRTSGEYDDVIDFDRVLRDPNSPTKILALYDSGDHLHPNDSGYNALANAINLRLFSTRRGRQGEPSIGIKVE